MWEEKYVRDFAPLNVGIWKKMCERFHHLDVGIWKKKNQNPDTNRTVKDLTVENPDGSQL